MKANPLALACVFLLLFAAAVQLPAQQPVSSSNTNATATNKVSATNVDFVPDNPIEALKVRAEKGEAVSQNQLGWMYGNGEGVAKDEVEAVKWYRKAAEKGLPQAQYNLGIMYDNGYGVAEDAIEAVKWYRKAAEQGVAEAQYSLGVCYYNGEGVAKDEVEAFKWWTLAANQNNADAKKYLPALEGSMSPDQITEGQKLVRNFKSRKELNADTSVSGF